MADLIINGTTYSGSPTNTSNPMRPSSLKRRRKKIGRLVEGKDGTQNWMHRGMKWEWDIGWEGANSTTVLATLAVRNLTTSFSFTDYNGTVYTVVNVGDDAYEEDFRTTTANAYLADVSITLREM